MLHPGQKKCGTETSTSEPSDSQLIRLLAEYQDHRAAGRVLSVAQFLRERSDLSPEVAAELEALLAFDSVIEERAPLERFGDFEVLREAGRGAMGIVYQARQASLDRVVALKILPASFFGDSKAVARFRREAKVAAKLHHPNLVGVYAMGVEAGIPYFAMEYSDGLTLRQILQRFSLGAGNGHETPDAVREKLRSLTHYMVSVGLRPPCDKKGDTPREGSVEGTTDGHSPPEARNAPPALPNATFEELNHSYCLQMAEAFAGAAEGLQHAHSMGITHRDLKPSNLILDSTGLLRILDFGVARLEGDVTLTASADRVGTPLYMSPEQAAGQSGKPGPSTDIYSLGASLYEVLAWRPPFLGKDYHDILDKIVHSEPTPLARLNSQVPRDLDTIVLKCLRKEPRDRYSTAEALAQDLRRFVRGDPIEARRQPLYERLVRRASRSKRKLAEVTGAAVLLIAMVLLGLNRLETASRQREAMYRHILDGAVMNLVKEFVVTPAARIDNAARRAAQAAMPHRKELRAQPSPTRFTDGSDVLFEIGSEVFGEAGTIAADVGPDPVEEAIDHLRHAAAEFSEKPAAHYYLATAFLLRGDERAAGFEVRKALDRDPGFFPALALEPLLSRRRDGPEAERRGIELGPIPEERPGSWRQAWLTAHQAVLRREWEEAARAFELLSTNRNDEPYPGALIETLLGRGVAHLNAGRPGEAVADFGAAREMWRDWPEPALLLGKALYLDGKRGAARREFEKLFARAEKGNVVHPGGKALGPASVAFSIALTYRDLSDLDEALVWLRQAGDGPTELAVRAELLSLDGRGDEAWEVVTRAFELDEEDVDVLLAAGNVRMAQEDPAAAQEWYERARRRAPEDTRPLISLGTCFEAQEKLDEARAAFELAIARDPASSGAHYDRARILSKQARIDDAINAYEQAISIDPANTLALNNLGTLLDRQGKHSEARAFYQRCTRVAPTLGLAHYNLAWALHREKRYGEAASSYRRAIDCGLDDAVLRCNLAACLHLQRKFVESELEYRAAIRMDPDYAIAHHELGFALEWQGRLPEAAFAYRQALRLRPNWIGALNNLGWALDREGEIEEAIACYHRAIELDPDFIWAHNNLATLLLRESRPIPEGDELARSIRRLEDAEKAANASPSVAYLLGAYRRSALPDLLTYGSIDALIDGPAELVSDEATWRFFRGATEPSPGSEWAEPGFDDGGWEVGQGMFGYPKGAGIRTVLEDMRGRYGSVYLRTRFTLDDPSRIDRLKLSVGADHGIVAYLNGREVGWLRTGGGDIPHDAVTEGEEWHPGTATELEIDPEALEPGENHLAVRAVNRTLDEPVLALRVVLGAEPVSRAEKLVRASERLRAFRDTVVMGDENARARLLYFEGRMLLLEGDYGAALERFRETVALDPTSAEPSLRLADCLQATGAAEEAETFIRQALESGSADNDRLWERWFHIVLLGLDVGPRDALKRFDRLTGGRAAAAGGRTADIIWMLERLEEGGPVRINCGGNACTTEDGRAWEADRFYRFGRRLYLSDLDGRDDLPSPAVYRTIRDFWEPARTSRGYRIPLPEGTYITRLHFVEGEHTAPGSRRFDVVLEGERRIEDYEPLSAGFGAPDPHQLEVSVTDGYLDIDFRRGTGHPVIAAIEIEKR